MTTPEPAEIIAKTQAVRALDVFALGPFLVWAAMHRGALPGWARFGLGASGVLAITYNALRAGEQAAGRPAVPAWIMGAQPGLAMAVAALTGALAARAAS